ncbi:caspase family protein [Taklimakanibacter lacteus]|uniref:caspase family protein n=1 Tax=Taklimakanibacter lacteus TaxID=2268456 RepID=UPI0013C459BE
MSALLLCIATEAGIAQEAKPEAGNEPQLRVEAGMHTAVARHVAVSADGKRIVSASYDKTIRVWSVPDGKLENVFRVPIGEGFEGSVFAIALSPDGKTIAAGGWMKKQYVYLIDATNGQVIRTLGPNSEVTMNLAFSPDGDRLAVTFGRNFGMRFYDVATGALVTEDTGYSDDTNGIAFAENGTFATGSYDGLLRLYAQDGSLLSQVKAPSGKKVFSVSFAAGTDKVAIGYSDVPKVDIFSTNNYEWLPQPDLSGMEKGDLTAVSWSKDGGTLYAGGAFRDETGWYRVVRWRDQGMGQRSFIYNSADTVLDLQPFGASGIVAVGALPQIAVLDNSPNDTHSKEAPLMELFTPIAGMGRNEKGAISVSADGSKVRFSLDVGGKRPVLFDTTTLELKDVTGIADDLMGPDITSRKIDNWNGGRETKVDDQILVADPHETSFSVALSPDKQYVALGTAWYIRRYDAQAKFLWRTAIPGVAWGTNIAQDGKVIVAAVGDGTIRWFRAEDGKELLALFVHNKDQRWILWTPTGYYAASPGGEDLIGWNINRAETMAPDFFPASRLRNTYYRPDIVQKVLATLDPEEAVKSANAEAGRLDEQPASGELTRAILPAVVELAMDSNEIKTATSPIQVSYRVRSPSGEPIEGIDILINGRPLEGRAAIAIPDEDEVTTLDIPIPSQNVEIGLIARTKTGASEVRIVKVLWDGAFAEMLKPKLYAVVVGVSDYANADYKLKYAAQDAKDFADALKRQEGGIYGKVDVRLLTDVDATRDDIVEALEWLEGEVTSRDVGMVFMAGHGVTDNKQRFYYLPVDGEMERLRSSAVSRDDLLATMSGLAGKAMMFIDACHSAASTRGEQTRSADADITQIVNELSSAENGVVMFASSTGRQLSIENDTWKNGAFTEALIEGFGGGADYVKDGKLTIAELDLWLSDRVKQLTDKRQSPVVRKPDTIPDFPIALVR